MFIELNLPLLCVSNLQTIPLPYFLIVATTVRLLFFLGRELLLASCTLNSFHATNLFLHPLKTSENQRFSDVFRWYSKRPVAWNELLLSQTMAFRPLIFFVRAKVFTQLLIFLSKVLLKTNLSLLPGLRGARTSLCKSYFDD